MLSLVVTFYAWLPMASLCSIWLLSCSSFWVLQWRWIVLIHLPAAAWGVFVELTSQNCPLTYLENYLRIKAGRSGYTESFIEHYILDIIYPSGLTREIQFALAGVVVVVNIAIYGWLFNRWRHGVEKDA